MAGTDCPGRQVILAPVVRGDHLFPIWMVRDDWRVGGRGDHQCPGGTACSRHRWSGGTGYSGTNGLGGPFIPDMDGPGGPIMGGTIGSMTGHKISLKAHRYACTHGVGTPTARPEKLP